MQYLDTTFYDRAFNWFLDQPFIAFIVLICVIIMAIPQFRDGIKILFQKKKKQAVKGLEMHVIEKNETLRDIAQRYGVTVSALCRLNGIEKSGIIREGDIIRLRK